MHHQNELILVFVYFHLYITDSCNLVCQYCRGKIFDTPETDCGEIAIDESIPAEVTFHLPDLYRFLGDDPDAVLTFIGENRHYAPASFRPSWKRRRYHDS